MDNIFDNYGYVEQEELDTEEEETMKMKYNLCNPSFTVFKNLNDLVKMSDTAKE